MPNEEKQTTEIVAEEKEPKKGPGKGKGKRPNRSKNLKVQTNPGDNAKYMEHALKLARKDKVNIKDPEAIAERIEFYFQSVIDDDMKPSVAGAALALGYDRKILNRIRQDETHPANELIKRVYQILDLQMNNYMQNGKINPVSGIFLMKNNFDYRDQQEVVVAPKNPLGAEQDQKLLEQKYIDSVAEDIDDE